MSIGYSEVVASLALLLSGYSMYKSSKFNEHQKQVNTNQDALNKRLLAKEESEILDSKKADIGANIIKLGQNKHRLKIFNTGASSARNVDIQFPDGSELVVDSDVNSKFPYEVLEPRAGIELIALATFGRSPKHKIILKWEDDFSKRNEKTVFVSM